MKFKYKTNIACLVLIKAKKKCLLTLTLSLSSLILFQLMKSYTPMLITAYDNSQDI